MTNPTADLLRSALALIEQPERWCQKSLYQDAKGNVFSREGDGIVATRRCGEGACATAANGIAYGKSFWLREALSALFKAVGQTFCLWQDIPWRTHAEVVAAFRRAIAIAEGAPPTSIDATRDADLILSRRLSDAEADRAALRKALVKFINADPKDAAEIRLLQMRAGLLAGLVP